jgi:hypothetical protein
MTPTALVIAHHPPTVRKPANINFVIATVVREAKTSSRYVTPDLGLTKPVGLRMFGDDLLHPFHYSSSAHLFLYYRLIQRIFTNKWAVLLKVLCTYEARFTC